MDGKPAPTSAWTPSFSGWTAADDGVRADPIVDGCADGYGFGGDYSGTQVAGPNAVRWTFAAPPDTAISSVTLRHVAWSTAGFAGTVPFRYTLQDDSQHVLEQSPQDIEWHFGAADSSRTIAGLDTSALSMEFSCSQGFRCGQNTTSTSLAYETRVSLNDSLPPTGEASPARVTFADRGGGVKSLGLLVDGSEVMQIEKCHEPFVARIPCPTTGSVELPVWTEEVARRARVEVVLVDAAGNRSVLAPFAPKTLEGATSPLMPPLAVVAPARPGVLALSGRRTIRARYSAPPVVRGTVKTAGGAAIGRARVSVSEAPGTVTTDAKGRFSVRLARGVSREVRFSYGESVQSVKVIVAAPVRLKTDRKNTRNGRAVKFIGSVPGAGTARPRVELQAWANGKWIPFKSADLRNGRFSASYRFTRTFSAMQYRFRAVIHADPDFPYAAGTSPVVKVVVRP